VVADSVPEPLTATNISGTTFSGTNVYATTVTATNITATNISATTYQKTVGQIVSTLYTTCASGNTVIPFDDTIPQITEGDEYFTCTITPKSTASTLYIEVIVHTANSSAAYVVVAALFQDATANALAAGYTTPQNANKQASIHFAYSMAAGTTSSTTFRVRVGASSGITTVNGTSGARLYGGVITSSIVITEVLP